MYYSFLCEKIKVDKNLGMNNQPLTVTDMIYNNDGSIEI